MMPVTIDLAVCCDHNRHAINKLLKGASEGSSPVHPANQVTLPPRSSAALADERASRRAGVPLGVLDY